MCSGPRWPKSLPLMTSLTKNPEPLTKNFFSSANYKTCRVFSVFEQISATFDARVMLVQSKVRSACFCTNCLIYTGGESVKAILTWYCDRDNPGSNPGHSTILLRSESPSSMCTKLHTVAASSNRDHAPQSLAAYASRYIQSFTC